MSICENCGTRLKRTVCLACGSALYNEDRVVVRITAANYNPEKQEELTLKFMAPLIKGTLQRMKN